MAFSKDEFRVRCNVHFRGGPNERARIDRLPDELLYAAATLNALAKLKKVKSLPLDCRNPQVRVALYMADWLNASTGKKQYGSLSTLIAAAFYASGEHSPPWADRLPIEMHRHRQYRRQWIASISKSK